MNFVSRPSYCKISSPSIYIYIYIHTHTLLFILFVVSNLKKYIYIHHQFGFVFSSSSSFSSISFSLRFHLPSSIHFLPRPSFIRGFKLKKIYIHHQFGFSSSSSVSSIPLPLRFVPSLFCSCLYFIRDFVSNLKIYMYVHHRLDLFLLLLLSLPFLSLFPSFVPSSIHFIRGFKLEKIYIYIHHHSSSSFSSFDPFPLLFIFSLIRFELAKVKYPFPLRFHLLFILSLIYPLLVLNLEKYIHASLHLFLPLPLSQGKLTVVRGTFKLLSFFFLSLHRVQHRRSIRQVRSTEVA